MASGAEEALQDSGSATSQLQRAGQQQAAADGPCPICLDSTDNTAYLDTCFHAFCFDCIQQWAAMRAPCPLCRRPFSCILHTVRADDDYQEYVVGSSAHRQRTAARQRVYSRTLQQRYNLRPRPTSEPVAGRRGSAEQDPAAWQGTAPRTSDPSTQQAAGERPASPANGPVLRFDELALQAQIVGFTDVE
ncbi:E3 ubiquitin-protein ligase Topors-like [Falco biarmicus]|uniref:E3 ubiquitin-protein ligase Topors-like n=1 Tax=Falco biarmicus TaxID=345155 RepID=UPI0024BC49BC|nr:E3 ubiquitin-protein ligase Topors-like [Falco biarmicus]